MSSFSFCVVSWLVLVTRVQSYAIREQVGVSFVDGADPSTGWTLEKQALSTNEDILTTNKGPYTVDTEDRQGLRGVGCPIGYKKAAGTCIKDDDYDSEDLETEYRSGIAGGFRNCPEGYRKAGSTCVPVDSDSEELRAAMPVKARRIKINGCPIGHRKVGPICMKFEDYESYEDEY